MQAAKSRKLHIAVKSQFVNCNRLASQTVQTVKSSALHMRKLASVMQVFQHEFTCVQVEIHFRVSAKVPGAVTAVAKCIVTYSVHRATITIMNSKSKSNLTWLFLES